MNVHLSLPGDHPRRHHPLSKRRAPRRMSTGTTTAVGTSDPNDDVLDKIRLSLPLTPMRRMPTDVEEGEGKQGSSSLGCILGFAFAPAAKVESSVSSSTTSTSTKHNGASPGVVATPPEPTCALSPLPSPSRSFHVSAALGKKLSGIASGWNVGGGGGEGGGAGGGGAARSLHKLFRSTPTMSSLHRTKSNRRQYLSVDCSDMSCVDIRTEEAELPPPLVTPPCSPLKTMSGRRASLPICGGTPTTIPEMDASSFDSLTDEYDGFYAGSLHSEQPQQAQQQQQQQPQQPLTKKHVVPAARVSPRRRSSMPTVSVATLHGDGGGSHGGEHSCSPKAATTWVHSPGSAHAHLEFRPADATKTTEVVGIIAGPPPLHPATSSGSSSWSSSTRGRDEGSSSDDCIPRGGSTADNYDQSAHDVDVQAFLSAPSLSPCRSTRLRHRYQRRRRSAGGGRGDGNADAYRNPVFVSVHVPSPLVTASPTRQNYYQHDGTRVATTLDEEEERAVADLFTSPLSTSSSSSPSSLSSPRRKTRRTATSRHITSRRRSSLSGTASTTTSTSTSSAPSSPSSWQHLRVPVV